MVTDRIKQQMDLSMQRTQRAQREQFADDPFDDLAFADEMCRMAGKDESERVEMCDTDTIRGSDIPKDAEDDIPATEPVDEIDETIITDVELL